MTTFTTHTSRRGASQVALVVVLSLLMVTAAVGAWYFFFRGPSLPADLQLVSHDSAAFISVRGEDVWKNETVQKVIKEFPGSDNWEKDCEELLGLKPADVERVTLVFPHIETGEKSQQFWTILLTKKPLDQEKFKKQMSATNEEKVKEKKYYTGGSGHTEAVHFAEEKVAVIGSAESVKAFLSQEIKTEGPLSKALNRAAEEHHVVAGFTIPEKVREETKQTPDDGPLPEVKALIPLQELKSGIVVMDVKEELEVELTAEYADEKKAKAAKDAIPGAIAHLKAIAPQRAVSVVAGEENGIKSELKGAELTVTLKIKDVAEKVKQVMPEPVAGDK